MLTLKRFQTLATVGVIVSGISMCALRDRNLENRGADKVVSTIAQQTETTSAKARKARNTARVPGSLERLRQSKIDCRDCEL